MVGTPDHSPSPSNVDTDGLGRFTLQCTRVPTLLSSAHHFHSRPYHDTLSLTVETRLYSSVQIDRTSSTQNFILTRNKTDVDSKENNKDSGKQSFSLLNLEPPPEAEPINDPWVKEFRAPGSTFFLGVVILDPDRVNHRRTRRGGWEVRGSAYLSSHGHTVKVSAWLTTFGDFVLTMYIPRVRWTGISGQVPSAPVS